MALKRNETLLIAFIILIAAVMLAMGLTIYIYRLVSQPIIPVINFESCVARGYPVLESYPAQCRTPDGRVFLQEIGNGLEKRDLIQVDNPRPNQKIFSPLNLKGQARGFWFFEASFPVRLFDDQGNEIAIAIAQAQEEWMTEEFVPFQTTLEFEKPAAKKGTLVFEKDNPSGLPEHDDQLIMPIFFE